LVLEFLHSVSMQVQTCDIPFWLRVGAPERTEKQRERDLDLCIPDECFHPLTFAEYAIHLAAYGGMVKS